MKNQKKEASIKAESLKENIITSTNKRYSNKNKSIFEQNDFKEDVNKKKSVKRQKINDVSVKEDIIVDNTNRAKKESQVHKEMTNKNKGKANSTDDHNKNSKEIKLNDKKETKINVNSKDNDDKKEKKKNKDEIKSTDEIKNKNEHNGSKADKHNDSKADKHNDSKADEVNDSMADEVNDSKADEHNSTKEKTVKARKKSKKTKETSYIKNKKPVDNIIRNIIIVTNLSYKETEESISEAFKQYGTIEKVSLQTNKENKFIGKALITFKDNVHINEEITLNNKILRIERPKTKEIINTRLFVSNIDKNLSILDIRNILRENKVKPKDIRLRFDTTTKKNFGYMHLTYKSVEGVEKFKSKWNNIKDKLGENCQFDFSKEKPEKIRK